MLPQAIGTTGVQDRVPLAPPRSKAFAESQGGHLQVSERQVLCHICPRTEAPGTTKNTH